jgi:poly-beta-1,6-N-acetyl-D-glucosamine biosynthesis protein PgaD
MNIIDGLQKKFIKRIEQVITTLGWIVILLFVIQILLSVFLWAFNLSNFYNKLFLFANIDTTIRVFLLTITFSLLFFIIIYLWRKYNYKKFAHLHRRTLPSYVTSTEIEVYFNLPSSLVEKMQNDKIFVLEKTIV